MSVTLFLFLLFLTRKAFFSNSKCYKDKYSFTTFGSLTSSNNILFTSEQNSRGRVIIDCSNFCREDRRCIGMEVCRIKEDLFRCRACCSWMITNKQQFISDDNCKYLIKEEGSFRNVAVNKPVTMSSVYNPTLYPTINAVNNLTFCPNVTYTTHSIQEHRPWIKIDLQYEYDVYRVAIFNLQGVYGAQRLNKLLISVGNTGTENECGYFGRTANAADQILIYCANGAVGRYIVATINSNPGIVDILNICEIQVFVK